jgi:subtilase family serine protease
MGLTFPMHLPVCYVNFRTWVWQPVSRAYANYKLANLVAFTSPPSGSFTPAQIQAANQFNQVSYNGSGETIAIVDAYNDPDIQSDLNTFDTQFNLPTTTISVVNETGGSSLPAANSTGGWEMEESLDVEWAHAMAPGANIVLVEASSDDLSDLLTAVNYASGHANVVSMSWGSSGRWQPPGGQQTVRPRPKSGPGPGNFP